MEISLHTRPQSTSDQIGILALYAQKKWKECDLQLQASTNRPKASWDNHTGTVAEGEIHALTVEAVTGNILIRAIQPRVLMVMDGIRPTPPRRRIDINAELKGQDRYPPTQDLPDMIDVSAVDLGTEKAYKQALKVATVNDDGTTDEARDTAENGVNETGQLAGSASGGETSKKTSANPTRTTTPVNGDQLSHEQDRAANALGPDLSALAGTSSNEELASVVLALQRTKLDNMADWYAGELQREAWVLET